MKRAIVLSGGGPAVGLSLGALKRLEAEPDIRFDVWTTSCIGAWLAAAYNQAPRGQGAEAAERFFRGVFRPDDVYARYPVAHVFTPDIGAMVQRMAGFAADPDSYDHLVVPHAIGDAMAKLVRFAQSPGSWTAHGLNDLVFNHLLPANPVARFATSLMFLSPMEGLTQLYNPENEILRSIDFDALKAPDKPMIYHNAYNMTDRRIDLFCNKPDGRHAPMTAQSLCACSALPFLETPMELDGKTYCEGAVVETVSFADLLSDHPDIDEVWISRILDRRQVKKPANLTDALTNLIMLFAAQMSENDVTLFKAKLAQEGRRIRVVEIPVALDIDYSWTHSNLAHGIAAGAFAADTAIADYRCDRATETPMPTIGALAGPMASGNLAVDRWSGWAS